MISKCTNCGANNRVKPDAVLRKQPVCGKCGTALPAPSMEPAVVTDANFANVVEASPLPVLLDLWASWCGPCHMIAPTIAGLARELAGKVLVGKLDVDANQRTAGRFGVQGIPTLLILKGGREVERLVGVQSRDAVMQRLQPYI